MPESLTPSPTPQTQKQNATLRPALPSDAHAIASLGAQTFTTTFGYSMPPADLEAFLEDSYSPHSILLTLQDPSITTLVAVSPAPESRVVGFSQLNRASTPTEPVITQGNYDNPVELQRLYVDTNFHGGGVGKMLVEGMEKISREEGYKTLWLGVWEENFKAHGFYERCGLRAVKGGFHDFKMGECVQRDMIFVKAI